MKKNKCQCSDKQEKISTRNIVESAIDEWKNRPIELTITNCDGKEIIIYPTKCYEL